MSPSRGVSAFTLKIAAIVGMTANHVANVFAGLMPFWLTVALYSLGGLTFPIMAFLLCEGYRHTSNIRRYARRLALFAALSQVPFSLLWGATANVLVTLLIGLGLLWAKDHLRNQMLWPLVVLAGLALSAFCDWGIIGPVMILLFHYWHDRPRGALLTMLIGMAVLGLPQLLEVANVLMGNPAPLPFPILWGALGYYTVGFALAATLLTAYNGQRGRSLKWFFYAYYPAHLLVIWIIAVSLGL